MTQRNKRQVSTVSTVYGKVPPQNIELEAAVLGAVLLEKDKLDDVFGIIPHEYCFYSDAHQKIYRAIKWVADTGSQVDLLTVTDALVRTEELEAVGGAYYLTQLTMNVVTSAHVESHARIIMEKYMLREMIRIGSVLVSNGYDESADVFDLINKAESELSNAGTIRTSYKKAIDVLRRSLKRMEEAGNSDNRYTGVPTGYDPLDRITYGWQPGDLIILAARPSVGKTAFMLNLAMNAAMHPEKPCGVGVFSLEMQDTKLADRMLSALSSVPMDNIKTGKLTPEQQHRMNLAAAKFAKAPIVFDDSSGLNIYELRNKARKMVRNDKVGLILIDYLQLMQGVDAKANREQEIAKISRDLKNLAKELNVPIIALSQLNRNVENRKDNKGEPQMSDLRESGAIEQDADMVIFLWRVTYQQTEQDKDPMLADDAYLKIGKFRDGVVLKMLFKFIQPIQKWFDPEGYDNFKGSTLFPTSDLPF